MNVIESLPVAEVPAPLCFAKLFKTAFDGADLKPLRDQILAQTYDTVSAFTAALMSLCLVEQILGNKADGVARQAEALALQRLYRSSWPASPNALRVVAFKAAGDFSTNTPIEFLLEGFDVVLYSLYVVPGQPLPDVPEHDIAIFTVGESDGDRPVMQEVEGLLSSWPSPVLNRPQRAFQLSREGLYRLLHGVPGFAIAPTARIDQDQLQRLGQGSLQPGHFLPDAGFPLIARPIGSHAGRGLAKLEDGAAIAGYLTEHSEAAGFFVSPYMDYHSADGQFRKYRIIWVDGQPQPHHMAIADQWKVWYYNADMAASPAKRAEEEQFMSCAEGSFLRRHEAVLAAVAKRLDLEYVGIDCAETPDGRLLIFEADISLVVHDMDPKHLYPYKSAPTQRLFMAFHDMLKRKSLAVSQSAKG